MVVKIARPLSKDTKSNFVDSLHTSSMDSFIFLRGWQIQVLINTILVCHICKIWIFVFRSTLQCKMEQLKSKGCLQIFEMAKVCTNLWIRIRWICRQIGKNWKWEKIYVTLSILHRAKIQWKWYHNEESSYNYKLWIKNFIVHNGKASLKRNRLINNTKLAFFIVTICKNVEFSSKFNYKSV